MRFNKYSNVAGMAWNSLCPVVESWMIMMIVVTVILMYICSIFLHTTFQSVIVSMIFLYRKLLVQEDFQYDLFYFKCIVRPTTGGGVFFFCTVYK